MLLGILLEGSIIFAYFHIFAYITNDGNFNTIGQYISELSEATPFAIFFLFVFMLIGHFALGLKPFFSFIIGILPYYYIIKFLNDSGGFLPESSEWGNK